MFQLKYLCTNLQSFVFHIQMLHNAKQTTICMQQYACNMHSFWSADAHIHHHSEHMIHQNHTGYFYTHYHPNHHCKITLTITNLCLEHRYRCTLFIGKELKRLLKCHTICWIYMSSLPEYVWIHNLMIHELEKLKTI